MVKITVSIYGYQLIIITPALLSPMTRWGGKLLKQVKLLSFFVHRARWIKIHFLTQHATSHFLQDGAPCHRAKMVTAWFKDRPNIQLIRWPGNSPDLNPIENVWAWMKRRLRDIPCTNMKQWREEITRLWVIKMADSQYLRNLVESMPRRLNEVIEREGATTKY